MTKFDIHEIDVCVVCIHLQANGEYRDGEDTAEKCAAGQQRIWGDMVQHFALGGEELGFTWASCEGCGNTDGGDRFRLNILVPLLDVDTVYAQYVETALWSSYESHEDSTMGDALDANYDESDLSAATRAELLTDCQSFVAGNAIDLFGMDPGQAGHDFWLTRNGHGAGFWDRGLGERGERLSAAAKEYGDVDLHVGDDGKIHS